MLTISGDSNVIIDPPEKLVLEVLASGSYAGLRWQKNGIGTTNNPTFPGGSEFFPNFVEMYVMNPSNITTDLGLYQIDLIDALLNPPIGVTFVVTSYSKKYWILKLKYNYICMSCSH